jgi:hypothetical protein
VVVDGQTNEYIGEYSPAPSTGAAIAIGLVTKMRYIKTSVDERDPRRTAWGVQGGRRQPQAALPVGGPPLKRPYSCFRGGPSAGCRKVGHGELG